MARTDLPATGVDVYQFPAVVGGGWGDVLEVREAGARLSEAGFPVHLYRGPGRPLPPEVVRLLAGARVRRVGAPALRHRRAMTVAAMWGVSAAPARPEPFGRAGSWSDECERLEAAYGAGRVLHVSLEEFARTLTSRQETAERYREGGRTSAAIRHRLATPAGRAEIVAFHRAYRKFRAFDRENLLHLYATFQPSNAFAREYPEAIQTGPLWPARSRTRTSRRPPRTRRWIWYASPSSSTRIVRSLLHGLEGVDPPVALSIWSPRPLDGADRHARVRRGPIPQAEWRRAFGSAELRIVTGSRTLLEALSDGRPFLYFNGISGTGAATRRHRPEKIRALLAAWRSEGFRGEIRRDLDAFSRGHRVGETVRRAATDGSFRRAFGEPWRPGGLRPPFDDAGGLIVELAGRWSGSGADAPGFVREIRAWAAASRRPGAARRPARADRV